MPNIPDVQKVNLATIHFEGKVLMWYQNLNIGEIRITWEQFLEVVCARFEDLKVTNIIMEFSKLKQDGTYDDYVERFQELMACMVLPDESKYSEEYYIACFLSGLSEELRAFIHISQPETLHQAIELGQNQLLPLEVIPKKWQPPDDDEAIFEAQKAIEFGIPEVDINMVEIVEELQGFVDPTFGEAGFVPRRTVGIVENHQLNIPFSPRLHKVEGYNLMLERDWFMFCPPIKWVYINMTFTTFLNWKKVKFKFFTRALVMTLITCSDLYTYSFTGSVLNTLLHEEITYADEIVLANAAGYATPTLVLDLTLEESSDIFVASKKMEERQFEVGGRVYLQLQFLRHNSVYLCKYLKSSSRFCESCQILEEKGINAGVPLRDGVESELGKNANDGLKHIRRTSSSLDPRGRGSYQPGGIVMAMVMGVVSGDEKKL